MLSDRDVRERLRAECDAVGLRQWCRQNGCDPSYVSKIISGDKGIGQSVCRALKLTPVTVYRKSD